MGNVQDRNGLGYNNRLMVDVSIIIVTYNTLKMTKECIDSVIQMTLGLKYEIILVDNNSQDGSRDFFSCDSRIKYIYSDKNLGFGKANNLGAKHSSGKYLFLLNSDTLLKNNAIKIFYDYMENSDKQIASCGCMLVDKDNNYIHSYGDRHTFANSLYEWLIFPITHKLRLETGLKKYFNPNAVDFPIEVGFVTGADVFLRREVYENYGLFDPDFFMYYEDAEMARRWQKAGFKNIVIKGPSIIHLVGASNQKKPLYRRAMVMNSMFLYFQKDRGKYSVALFKIVFKTLYIITFVLEMPIQNGTICERLKHIKDVIKI